jgi:hypothetical protein
MERSSNASASSGLYRRTQVIQCCACTGDRAHRHRRSTSARAMCSDGRATMGRNEKKESTVVAKYRTAFPSHQTLLTPPERLAQHQLLPPPAHLHPATHSPFSSALVKKFENISQIFQAISTTSVPSFVRARAAACRKGEAHAAERRRTTSTPPSTDARTHAPKRLCAMLHRPRCRAQATRNPQATTPFTTANSGGVWPCVCVCMCVCVCVYTMRQFNSNFFVSHTKEQTQMESSAMMPEDQAGGGTSKRPSCT